MQRQLMMWCCAAVVLASLPGYSGQKGSRKLFHPADTPAATESVLPPMLAAARQAILSEATLAEIEDCELITEDGELVYEVSCLRGGLGRTFTVTPNGTLRSRQCFRKELPLVVQQAVDALEKRGIIGDIYWCNEDGDLVYEVEVGVGEDKRQFSISPDGIHLATERKLNELPEAAQKTIREQAGADTLIAIARDETEVGDVFDAVILRNSKRRVVSVNAVGTVVATQIILLQAPAAVQDTITQTVGAAQIVYIGQCEEAGSTCYAVITYRGLKRDEFVVNADGKLHSHVVPLATLPEAAQKILTTKADGARIARIEKLADGSFEAELDRNGKKQILSFTADGVPR